MGAMSEAITFETMPKAMEYLIGKIDALEKVLLENNKVPAIPAIIWFNIDELANYLPDRPARATIYGWASRKEIPYHKGGKKLRFLKSEIDAWLSNGKRKSQNELKSEAKTYCTSKNVSK